MKVRAKKPRTKTHSFNSERVDKGWFYPQRNVIRLQFPDEVEWEYEDCTLQTWNSLITASSAGKYLRKHLDTHEHHAVNG